MVFSPGWDFSFSWGDASCLRGVVFSPGWDFSLFLAESLRLFLVETEAVLVSGCAANAIVGLEAKTIAEPATVANVRESMLVFIGFASQEATHDPSGLCGFLCSFRQLWAQFAPTVHYLE